MAVRRKGVVGQGVAAMSRKSLRALAAVAVGGALAGVHIPARAALAPNTILASGSGGTNATTLAFVQGRCGAAFVNDPLNGVDALVLDVAAYVGRRSVNVTWKTPVPSPTGYLVASIYSAGPACASTGLPKVLSGDAGTASVLVPVNGKWLIIGSQGRVNTTITLS